MFTFPSLCRSTVGLTWTVSDSGAISVRTKIIFKFIFCLVIDEEEGEEEEGEEEEGEEEGMKKGYAVVERLRVREGSRSVDEWWTLESKMKVRKEWRQARREGGSNGRIDKQIIIE